MSSDGSGKTPEPWRRPEPGDTIGGRYVLRRMLGRGSFAEVWEAEDQRVAGRLVALKHIGNATDPETVAYFKREMQILGSIDNEHVVKLHHTFVEHGRHWMVQELITGPSLDSLLRTAETTTASSIALTPLALPGANVAGNLDACARHIACVFLKLARTLEAVHAQKITHRDIKPANIMFRADGSPVFIDFGLARAEQSAVIQGTQLGAPGSLTWQSPEIVAGTSRGARFDPTIDVWALGLTLYQCLTLRQPFARATDAATRDAILSEDPLPPSRLAPAVPRDLGTIALATLEKEPRLRLKTAADLANDLQRFIDGHSIRSRPPSLFGRLLRFVRRQPALASLLVLIVLLPVVGGGVWLWYAPRLAAAEALELREAVLSANLAGYAAFFEQQPAVALERFNAALLRDPTDPEAVCGKVLAQKALGQKDEPRTTVTSNVAALQRTPLLRVLARSESEGPAEAWVRDAMEQAHSATDFFLLVQALRDERSGSAIQLRAECGHRALLASGVPSLLHLIAAAWSAGAARNVAAVHDADFAIRTHASGSAEALHQAGLALSLCGELELALERLSEAQRLAPERQSLMKDLAQCMASAGKGEAARELLASAVRKWPQHATCRLELGTQLEKAGLLAEALAQLEEVLKLQPKHQEAANAATRLQALLAYAAGDVSKLGNAEALIEAAVVLQRTNMPGAHLLLDRALQLVPQSARALREKVSLHLRQNDFDDAEQLLPRALAAAEKLDLKSPAERRLFNNIHSDAMALAAQRGHIDLALSSGERLVRSEPTNFVFQLNYAMPLLRNMNPSAALDALHAAESRRALDARSLVWRAQAELALGRWEECAATADMALARSPQEFVRKDAVALQTHARALLALDPEATDPLPSPLRGEALAAKGRHAEAVPHLFPLLQNVVVPELPGPTPLRQAAVTAVRAIAGAAHADQRRFKAAAIRFLSAEIRRLETPDLRRSGETEEAGLNELANCPVLTTLLFASAHIPPADTETWQLEQELLATLRPLSRKH